MPYHEDTSSQYPLDMSRINAIASMDPDEFVRTFEIGSIVSIDDLAVPTEHNNTYVFNNVRIRSTINPTIQTTQTTEQLLPTQTIVPEVFETNQATSSGRSLRKRSNIQKHPYTIDSATYNSIVDKIIATAPSADAERRVLQSYEQNPKRQRTRESRYESDSSNEDFNCADDVDGMEEDEEIQSGPYDLCSEDDTIEDNMDLSIPEEPHRTSSKEIQKYLHQPSDDEFSLERSLEESQTLLLPNSRLKQPSQAPARALITYQGKKKKNKNKNSGIGSRKNRPSTFMQNSVVSVPKNTTQLFSTSSQSLSSSTKYSISANVPVIAHGDIIDISEDDETIELSSQEDDEIYGSPGQLQLNRTRRMKNRYIALEDSDNELEEASVEDVFEFPEDYDQFTKRSYRRKALRDDEIDVFSQESRESSPNSLTDYSEKGLCGVDEENIAFTSRAFKTKPRRAERNKSPEDSFIVPDEQYMSAQRVKAPTIDDLQNKKKFTRGVLPLSFQKVYSNEIENEKYRQKPQTYQKTIPKAKSSHKKPIPIQDSDEDMSSTEESVKSNILSGSNNGSNKFVLSSKGNDLYLLSDSEDESPLLTTHSSNSGMSTFPTTSQMEKDIQSAYLFSKSVSQPQRVRRKKPGQKKKTIPYKKPAETIPTNNILPYRRRREPEPQYTRLSIEFNIEPLENHSRLDNTIFLKKRFFESIPVDDEMDVDSPYNSVCLPCIPTATFGKDTGGKQTIDDALSVIRTLFWDCFKCMSSPWDIDGVFNEDDIMPKCTEFFNYVTFCLTDWIPSLKTEEDRTKSAKFFRKNIEALSVRIMKLSGDDFYADDITIAQEILESGVWKQLVTLLLFTLDWLIYLETLDPQGSEDFNDPLELLDSLVDLTLQDDSKGSDIASKNKFKTILSQKNRLSIPTRERVMKKVDYRFCTDRMINHLLRLLMTLGYEYAKITTRGSLVCPSTPIVTEAWIYLINLLRTRLDSNTYIGPETTEKSTTYLCQVLIDHLKAESVDFDMSVLDKGEDIWNWLYTLQRIQVFNHEGQYDPVYIANFGHCTLVGNILNRVCELPDEHHPRSSRKRTICSNFTEYWETFLYRCQNFLGIDQG
ncbi:hypothetical protein J3Q64DRAFT_1744253 [Phycomyces blakesleeanus]|uniref:Uncharacterized protein n=1 Tax=Phycomyces blakesleeanus TaxID=4837 RepID=A0ABR3B0E4_PHYBL